MLMYAFSTDGDWFTEAEVIDAMQYPLIGRPIVVAWMDSMCWITILN